MGGYEKEFSYFVRMIPSEGTILDIGANIGIMTTMLAKKCNAAAIYAFEPMPENVRALEKVIRFHRLKNVQIVATALGDRNGMVQMIMPVVNHSKMQGLSHVVMSAEQQQGEIFSVPIQRMDDMPALQALEKITAIKLDVENFEYYVLKGGWGILNKHKPIVYCELWDDERRELCIDFMKKMGYRTKVYRKGELVDFDGHSSISFFFLP